MLLIVSLRIDWLEGCAEIFIGLKNTLLTNLCVIRVFILFITFYFYFSIQWRILKIIWLFKKNNLNFTFPIWYNRLPIAHFAYYDLIIFPFQIIEFRWGKNIWDQQNCRMDIVFNFQKGIMRIIYKFSYGYF